MERFQTLSPREHEVLLGAAQLKSSKEIALDLGLHKATVDKHIASAIAKLGARSRRHAAMMLVAYLTEHNLPIRYHGDPIILPFQPLPARSGGAKGGPDVPFDPSHPDDYLGRPGDRLRPAGDDAGGAGEHSTPSNEDPSRERSPVTAGPGSRDHLHRLRADTRERAGAGEPDAAAGRSPLKRLILILLAAFAACILAVGILALVIQVGQMSTDIDNLLRTR